MEAYCNIHTWLFTCCQSSSCTTSCSPAQIKTISLLVLTLVHSSLNSMSSYLSSPHIDFRSSADLKLLQIPQHHVTGPHEPLSYRVPKNLAFTLWSNGCAKPIRWRVVSVRTTWPRLQMSLIKVSWNKRKNDFLRRVHFKRRKKELKPCLRSGPGLNVCMTKNNWSQNSRRFYGGKIKLQSNKNSGQPEPHSSLQRVSLTLTATMCPLRIHKCMHGMANCYCCTHTNAFFGRVELRSY